MFPRFFSPALSHRLFDPMPLPKRIKVVVGRSRVQVGRLRAPKNHVGNASRRLRIEVSEMLFARKIKKIPANR